MTRAMVIAVFALRMAWAQPDTREVVLGKALAQEVERNSVAIADPAVLDYLNRLGRKVAGAPFTVKVLAGDNPHAIALPGVGCYLNAGLILKSASEADLAEAIAHQLAHLALWNEFQAGPVPPSRIPLIWADVCLRGRSQPPLGRPPEIVQRQLALEAEADRLAIGYLQRAGFDRQTITPEFREMQHRLKELLAH